MFSVDSNTGVISTTTASTFDVNVTPHYVLTLTAIDGGDVPKSSSTAVNVSVATGTETLISTHRMHGHTKMGV